MTDRLILTAEDPRRHLLTGEQIRAALDLLFSPEWGKEPPSSAAAGAAVVEPAANNNGNVSDNGQQ